MNDLKKAIDYLNLHDKNINNTVVFDIDGTLVVNEKYCKFAVIELYYHAIKLGYKVFLITARLRDPDNITFTIEMLEKCGIKNYDGLMMRPYYEIDLYKYKRDQRKFLHDNGYNIVMSVGDMDFDFGEYGGLSIRV